MLPEDFLKSVQSGDITAVRDHLAQDACLASVRDAAGVSALMLALYRGSREVAEMIRRARPELDIFEAASLGDVPRIRTLLKATPALVNSWSADGFTALHFASFFRCEEAARILLEEGADVRAVARNPMQVMPLHSAAAARSVAIVRALLDRGAPPNAKQQKGWTALHAAAQHGDIEMFELLAARGADPDAPNDDGVTPSQLAPARRDKTSEASA